MKSDLDITPTEEHRKGQEMTYRDLPNEGGEIIDLVYRNKFIELPDIIASWAEPWVDVRNAEILDFGCGEATTALGFALRKGAKRVVGVDVVSDPTLCLPYAQRNLKINTLPSNIELHHVLPGSLHNDGDRFDLIYAWSVMEHVREDILDETLAMMHSRLRDGGLLFIQISPLYYSSDGSHMCHRVPERWGHLRHQHSEYLAMIKKGCDSEAEYESLVSTYETLNLITAPRMMAAITQAGLVIEREHYREEDQDISPEVAEVYHLKALRLAEIVILARRLGPPEGSNAQATAEGFCPVADLVDNTTTDHPERLLLDLPRFCFDSPSHNNALTLRAGSWKFDFDQLDVAGIQKWVRNDVRPVWSSEIFPDFSNFSVIVLGPQDGFVTAGLEAHGIGSIVSVEANVDSFIRCLMLKNALSLKTTYLLGDFTKDLSTLKSKADLVYASGVLYHMEDPLELLRLCANAAPNIYLWTFYYEAEAIAAHEHESLCFDGMQNVTFFGQDFTYHKRFYHPSIRSQATYAGGIHPFANWMTLTDVRRALETLGYRILREVPDAFNGVPAMNIWASST